VTRWIPRRLGRLESIDEGQTRLLATTDEPDWYCRQLLALPAHFRIVEPVELRDAASVMIQTLLHAGGRLPEPTNDSSADLLADPIADLAADRTADTAGGRSGRD